MTESIMVGVVLQGHHGEVARQHGSELGKIRQ